MDTPCSHIRIGLYTPISVVQKFDYPIGMINGEYHWGTMTKKVWKCPQCFEIITDPKYIPIEKGE